jgi:hypothetical protein
MPYAVDVKERLRVDSADLVDSASGPKSDFAQTIFVAVQKLHPMQPPHTPT